VRAAEGKIEKVMQRKKIFLTEMGRFSPGQIHTHTAKNPILIIDSFVLFIPVKMSKHQHL